MFYSKSSKGFYDAGVHGGDIPADAVELSDAQYIGLMTGQSGGKVIKADLNGFPVLEEPLPPTAAQVLISFTDAIQKRLDDFARTRHYDGILSACSYATSNVGKFKTEGQACVDLRDATWAAAYDILAEVEGGFRPMPGSIGDIESDLPTLGWPA